MPLSLSGQPGTSGAQPGTFLPGAVSGDRTPISLFSAVHGGSVVGTATISRDRGFTVSINGLSAVASSWLRYMDAPARLLAGMPAARNLWRLNELSGTTAYDHIGTDNGTVAGTTTKGVTGLLNGSTDTAYNMGGVAGNYVKASTVTWTPPGNGSFAISFWQNPATRTNYNNQIHGNGGWGTFYFHTDTNGDVYCGIASADRFDNTLLGANTLTTGSSQHFVFYYDGIKGWFYKNGVLLQSKTMAKGTTGWGGFFIGNTDTSTISGAVDEVAIFGGALSSPLINQYYLVATGTQYASQIICGAAVTGTLTGGTTPITGFSAAGGSTVGGTLSLANTTTNVRLTQAAIEALTVSSPNVRLTQAPIEVLTAGSPNVRLTQAPIEVLTTSDPNIRLTQASVEVIAIMNPSARVSQIANEVLYTSSPNVRLTQLAIEVLRSVNILPIAAVGGYSVVAGSATIQNPITPVEVSVNGWSTVAGALSRLFNVSGTTISGSSLLSAILRVHMNISGDILTGSTVGSPILTYLLGVSVAGNSVVAPAAPVVYFSPTGAINGFSAVTGTERTGIALSGTSAGSSTPSIIWANRIASHILTKSTVSGHLGNVYAFSGSSAGKSTAALFWATKPLVGGAIITYSVVVGTVNIIPATPTAINGKSIVTVTGITLGRSATVTVFGKSTVAGYLVQSGVGGVMGDGIPMRLTQYVAETVVAPSPYTRLTQYVIEVVGVVGSVQGPPEHRFGWIVDYGG